MDRWKRVEGREKVREGGRERGKQGKIMEEGRERAREREERRISNMKEAEKDE